MCMYAMCVKLSLCIITERRYLKFILCFDFLQNLTITRLPDEGVCYIKPLDKSLSSPRKMQSDMSYVSK